MRTQDDRAASFCGCWACERCSIFWLSTSLKCFSTWKRPVSRGQNRSQAQRTSQQSVPGLNSPRVTRCLCPCCLLALPTRQVGVSCFSHIFLQLQLRLDKTRWIYKLKQKLKRDYYDLKIPLPSSHKYRTESWWGITVLNFLHPQCVGLSTFFKKCYNSI